MKNEPRLKTKYSKKIMPDLKKEFKLENSLAVPRLVKVVINLGIGNKGQDEKLLTDTIDSLKAITGQKPVPTKAKKAISEFKVRKGDIVGLKTTLRGKRMYYFLDKLFTIVLPRLRDFQGVSRVLDRSANYTLGLKELTIFPEVNYDKIDRSQGLEISFITNTDDRKQAEKLLEFLGMPFSRNGGITQGGLSGQKE